MQWTTKKFERNYEVWHPWFAWLPVPVSRTFKHSYEGWTTEKCWVWWKPVDRRYGVDSYAWEYAPLGTHTGKKDSV